jgi:hypothetical protein
MRFHYSKRKPRVRFVDRIYQRHRNGHLELLMFAARNWLVLSPGFDPSPGEVRRTSAGFRYPLPDRVRTTWNSIGSGVPNVATILICHYFTEDIL